MRLRCCSLADEGQEIEILVLEELGSAIKFELRFPTAPIGRDPGSDAIHTLGPDCRHALGTARKLYNSHDQAAGLPHSTH
jgi:hypothetical protein